MVGFLDAWWTVAPAWIEAIALIGILVVDLFLARSAIQERREARKERFQEERARQRSEVTCAGVTSILRDMTEEQLCLTLWASHFRQAGFAFEKDIYPQLPEYLRRKCEPVIDEIKRPIPPGAQQNARFLLVFRLPYPAFDAVLTDVNRLHFGNVHLVWDDQGNQIKVPTN